MDTAESKVLQREKTQDRPQFDEGVQCPHCGAAVPANAEFCPECGHRLVPYCPCCGSYLDPGASVCDECGMPVAGIVCPRCGTLNQRSFCRSCGEPLNKAAVRAVEKAAAEPAVRQCRELSEEVAKLDKQLETAPPAEREEIIQKKAVAVKSIGDLLSSMLPPVGATPQQKQIFYSARKVAVTVETRTKVRVGWVCNYCGCTHTHPSECCRPELGGKWLTEEKIETNTEYR